MSIQLVKSVIFIGFQSSFRKKVNTFTCHAMYDCYLIITYRETSTISKFSGHQSALFSFSNSLLSLHTGTLKVNEQWQFMGSGNSQSRRAPSPEGSPNYCEMGSKTRIKIVKGKHFKLNIIFHRFIEK